MALGGEVVIMPSPDLVEFLALTARHRVTHTFLPPTLIYLLLDHAGLPGADLSSLRCLWYGAAPMSSSRLEQAIAVIGPVLGQLFGQTEAPMMISTLAPADHLNPDGTLARSRFASAGRPTPLTAVAIMAEDGTLLPPGERGEIVARGPLVTPGYYKNPAATAEASRYGWHHRRCWPIRPSSTAPSSACRTTSGVSGSPPSSSATRATRPARTTSGPSSGCASAASRRPSRWRSGPTCRGRVSARC
jgi:acyl-CoA synthetase (AMP-forming)/AMP-acid ligase II